MLQEAKLTHYPQRITFVRFGAYSVYGGGYHGKPTRFIAEWIQHSERIPLKEYEQAATTFHPTEFSAERVVGLAKGRA